LGEKYTATQSHQASERVSNQNGGFSHHLL
jgi:hypothetical protein